MSLSAVELEALMDWVQAKIEESRFPESIETTLKVMAFEDDLFAAFGLQPKFDTEKIKQFKATEPDS